MRGRRAVRPVPTPALNRPAKPASAGPPARPFLAWCAGSFVAPLCCELGTGPRQLLILLSATTPGPIALCLAWSSWASLPWSSDQVDTCQLDWDLTAAEHAVPGSCFPSSIRILRGLFNLT